MKKLLLLATATALLAWTASAQTPTTSLNLRPAGCPAGNGPKLWMFQSITVAGVPMLAPICVALGTALWIDMTDPNVPRLDLTYPKIPHMMMEVITADPSGSTTHQLSKKPYPGWLILALSQDYGGLTDAVKPPPNGSKDVTVLTAPSATGSIRRTTIIYWTAED